MTRPTTLVIALAACAAAALPSTPALAGELQVAAGAAGAASDWRGDGAAYGSFKLGYRFEDLISFHALTRLGYGRVDDRMLTFLSLGTQIYGRLGFTRPYGRLALVHQHEESYQAIQGDAAGALFGVGDGIRHRGGGELGLGVDLPFHRDKAILVSATVEGYADYFPDPRGPSWYGGGGIAIGIDYTL